jgi:hypoxanthine phosphoribosyltransferase
LLRAMASVAQKLDLNYLWYKEGVVMEKKNRVLIVDDEADLRSSVISMFQQELPQVICEQSKKSRTIFMISSSWM